MMAQGIDLKSERPKRSLWKRIVDLAMTDVGTLVKGIDERSIEDLEQLLLEADFGVDATMELVDELERASRQGEVRSEVELRELLESRIRGMLEDSGPPRELTGPEEGVAVHLILGVNGTGKTTTAAKLAWRFQERGERVMLAAADTFRAGAQDQLRVWADRLGAEFVGGAEGGDPAAVAFDAVQAATSRGVDRLFIDTAGRLHTQRGLVEELSKIDRVVARQAAGAPHERILVVDATSGQNVISQTREFGAGLELTGLVLSKFDSTARGGTVVAVARELGVPVRYVGTGEQPADLELFEPGRLAARVLGEG
jgi:fused signal recognition particle receptor